MRRLKQQLSQGTGAYTALHQQLDKDNDALKTELGKLGEAFAIRSQHLESLTREQNRQFRQESELNKNSMTEALTQLREALQQQQNALTASQQQQFLGLQKVLAEQLKTQTEQVRHNVDSLNKTTESRLKDIATRVNQQLEQ
ncbi:MAG: hypothetical protein CSA11_12345, partial [Chloroflexi bacterium]